MIEVRPSEVEQLSGRIEQALRDALATVEWEISQADSNGSGEDIREAATEVEEFQRLARGLSSTAGNTLSEAEYLLREAEAAGRRIERDAEEVEEP